MEGRTKHRFTQRRTARKLLLLQAPAGKNCLTKVDKVTIIGNAQLYNGLVWDEGGHKP